MNLLIFSAVLSVVNAGSHTASKGASCESHACLFHNHEDYCARTEYDLPDADTCKTWCGDKCPYLTFGVAGSGTRTKCQCLATCLCLEDRGFTSGKFTSYFPDAAPIPGKCTKCTRDKTTWKFDCEAEAAPPSECLAKEGAN